MPMQRVVSGLRQRGVGLADRRALDVFAGTGERALRYYAPLVRHVDAWDYDEHCVATLQRDFPFVNSGVVDSYREIRRTQERYDFVIADNHITPIEHFGLFPHVLRVLSEDAILSVIVLPEAGDHEEHLANRRAFYGTDSPRSVAIHAMVARYGELAQEEGLRLGWHFYVPRRDMRGIVPVDAGATGC